MAVLSRPSNASAGGSAAESEVWVDIKDGTVTLKQGQLATGERFEVPATASAPVLTSEHLDLPFTYEAMAEAGSMLGTASVIVVDVATVLLRSIQG